MSYFIIFYIFKYLYKLFKINFSMKFDVYNHDNFWNVVLGMLITWGATYCAKQTQVQRYLSMRSQAHARRLVDFVYF